MEKQTFFPQNTRVICNLLPDWGEVLENSSYYGINCQVDITNTTVSYKGSNRTIIEVTPQ